MSQRWETLTFLHWPYDAAAVQPLLPDGLEVETFDGQAWVGLVPFHMTVGPGAVTSVPWLGSFHETNVRTYVRDPEGRSGVWFLSLDAQRLAAVVAGRAAFGVPYFWSSMALRRTGDEVHYACRRQASRPGARSRVVVRVGKPFADDELGPLDHFLTARYALFGVGPLGRLHVQVEHEPWPLRRAEGLVVHDQLVRRAGLPAPEGEPLVHFSEGVEVRIGPPRRTGSTS